MFQHEVTAAGNLPLNLSQPNLIPDLKVYNKWRLDFMLSVVRSDEKNWTVAPRTVHVQPLAT